MSKLSDQQVMEALRAVREPVQQRDLATSGIVRNLLINEGRVSMTVLVPSHDYPYRTELEAAIHAALTRLPGVEEVQVKFDVAAPQQQQSGPVPGGDNRVPVRGVRDIIAVASGKGGVGKTTVSVNMAVALARLGARVGLMDADVYGPNVPLMMGTSEQPRATGDRIHPLENYGVKLMSMGFLNPGDRPLIWRGPMLHSVIQQFIRNVEWGDIDYLIVDLPPGTGDVQLTLLQTVPIAGAVIVTTPSDVSLEDARKAIQMFRQVKAEVLGVVENMSYLICPHCGKNVDVFSHGGGERTAAQFAVPFLGHIPLDPEIRVGGDTGVPIVARGPESAQAKAFYEIARTVMARLGEGAAAAQGPTLRIRD